MTNLFEASVFKAQKLFDRVAKIAKDKFDIAQAEKDEQDKQDKVKEMNSRNFVYKVAINKSNIKQAIESLGNMQTPEGEFDKAGANKKYTEIINKIKSFSNIKLIEINVSEAFGLDLDSIILEAEKETGFDFSNEKLRGVVVQKIEQNLKEAIQVISDNYLDNLDKEDNPVKINVDLIEGDEKQDFIKLTISGAGENFFKKFISRLTTLIKKKAPYGFIYNFANTSKVDTSVSNK